MKTATTITGHLLILCVITACSLIAIASYFRFFVYKDYIVAYEGTCDPHSAVCFFGCKNDDCTETYYYSKVQKYGADLYAECGDDITNCNAANACLPTDRKCSITFCDTNNNGGACAQFNAGTESFNSTFQLNN